MLAVFSTSAPSKHLIQTLFTFLTETDQITEKAQLRLLRFGGCGCTVSEFEWQLSEDISNHVVTFTSIGEIAELMNNPAAAIEELVLCSGSIAFGVMDSAFVFLQTRDLSILESAAATFRSQGYTNVQMLPDLPTFIS